MQIVRLANEGLSPSRIMTVEALENMIWVYLAIGRSTNSLLHQLALSVEPKLQRRLKAWEPPQPRVRKGMLAICAPLPEPASRGAMPKMMI